MQQQPSVVMAPRFRGDDDSVCPLSIRTFRPQINAIISQRPETQTDGPVSFMIVDFQAPDRLGAYARFDAKRLSEGQDSGALLGRGHLAMTIDQGSDMSRYQGMVALDGGSLEDAAHEYFLRSEQIPTRVRLAVGEEWRGGEGPTHRWRAGGMVLPFLPKAPGRAQQAGL